MLATELGLAGVPDALVTAHMRHSGEAVTGRHYKDPALGTIFSSLSKLPSLGDLQVSSPDSHEKVEIGAEQPAPESDRVRQANSDMLNSTDNIQPLAPDGPSGFASNGHGARDSLLSHEQHGFPISSGKPPRGLDSDTGGALDMRTADAILAAAEAALGVARNVLREVSRGKDA